MYKKLYKKLDKDLNGIRREKNILNYNIWSKSKSVIDEFYDKDTISSDILYSRLMYLKRNSEEFKVIKLPSYMSIIFGVFVTISINAVTTLFDDLKEFLVKSKEMVEKALEKVPSESIQEANNIIDKTFFRYILFIALFIIILIVVALALVHLIKSYRKINNPKLEVREYEINKVQLLLDALEEKGLVKINTILKLENSGHFLEYTLTKVTKK